MHRRTQRAAFSLLTLAALLPSSHPAAVGARPALATQIAPAPPQGASAAAAVALEAGKPVERGLAGGEVHAYTVALAAGQFLHVVAEQRGIDIVVALHGPDGKLIQEVDSPNGARGPEPLRFVAKEAGGYRIEVRSLDKSAPAGRYEIRIEAQRAATEADRMSDLAARLAAAGTEEERAALLAGNAAPVTKELVGMLNNEGVNLLNRRNYPQALSTFQLMLRLAEGIGDKSGLAFALSGVASVHQGKNEPARASEFLQKGVTAAEAAGEKRLLAGLLTRLGENQRVRGDFVQSLEAHRKSLKLNEELENKAGIAAALGNVGFIYSLQGENAQALDYLQRSLKLNEELGNKTGMAFALVNLAGAHRALGDPARALEYAQRSLKLNEEAGNKRGTARPLAEIGLIHRGLGNHTQALEHFQRALEIQEASGDKVGVGLRLANISNIYAARGDNERALEYSQKALKVAEEIGNRPGVANALLNVGDVYRLRGDHARALEHFERSLKLSEELRAEGQIAGALSAIGNVHLQQSNYSRALEYFERSLKLFEERRNRGGIAMSLHRIGIVHHNLGDNERALDYFQRDLKLREELGDKTRIADTLNTIGIVHHQNKNYTQALELYGRSLAIMQEVGNKRGVAIALGNIGDLHAAEGRYEPALEHYRRTLKLGEEMGDNLVIQPTLNNIGDVHRRRGEYAEALSWAVRAADLGRRTGQRGSLWVALTTEGQLYRATGEPAKARQAFEEAIRIVEAIRSDIAGEKTRASYFAKARELYESYTDLLMEMHRQKPAEGFDAAALHVSERARARSLLEILIEANADIRQGVNPELLDRERALQAQLNVAAERQARLLGGKPEDGQAAAVAREITDLTSRLQGVLAQVRTQSPRYAALTQPEPLGLKEIQRQVVDADSLLLEYSLGEERSYLWLVTPASLKTYVLPPRAEIEGLARRAHESLSTRGRAELRGLNLQRGVPVSETRKEYPAELVKLGEVLLGPVASELGTKRLIVVADGALQYVPFAALPAPSARTGAARRPLVVEHEIVSLPSASVLSVLRRETGGRAPAQKRLAVLADPVFNQDDKRLSAPGAKGSGTRGAPTQTAPEPKATEVGAAATRSLIERAIGPVLADGTRAPSQISRLPFTRREAQAILTNVPAGQGMQALDFRASRETATGGELAEYRIVHFATHGILNSEHPELSGVVLSLFDERGQPADGFLRLHEIYNLKLPAELVVLSACQTALGKEIRGEGLVGLTRGFMYAGSPRVVASLWQVNDEATAEMMKLFYEAMLRKKEPLRPAAALRAAQVEMLKKGGLQSHWREPYYWAAFQLQGEWK